MSNKYNDFKIHTVKGNESVQDICMANNISEGDLAQANPQIPLASYGGSIFSSAKYKLDIKEGDMLKIPFFNGEKDKKGVKKIQGNNTVKVGVWEDYKVTEWYEGTPVEDQDESKVKWDLYLIKNGVKPELVLQKDEGKIRFQEKAVGNTFKVVAYINEPELNNGSAMLLQVEPAVKKEILGIKVTDINGQPIKGALAYGQKINVHVETAGMKGEYVYISLWEDDKNGSGHNADQNATNKVIKDVKSLVGDKGVAHESFEIKADFEKIANAYLSKGDTSEGKEHEYYVTAYATGETKSSPNFNVRNPKYQEQRKTETQQHIDGKGQPPKSNVPPYRAKPGTTQPIAEKGISKVLLTKNGTKQLLVTINSKGLVGKKIRFKLLEQDTFSNDLLINQIYTLDNDVYRINVFLDRVDQSLGGGYLTEGNEQELFVDIEVLETQKHIASEKLNVDITAFKVEVAESTTVAKVADSKVEVPKGASCGEKFCIKKGDKSELIREINIRLAGFGGNVPTDEFTDRTEKMIKQFQRDYMKVPETGKVCGNVLLAIDDFSNKFDIGTTFWNQLKCSCSTKGKQATSELRGIKEKNVCDGFGYHTGKNTYKATPHNEANHNYEYPGIHRSLLFGLKALKFYFSKQTVYSLDLISSGYRCRFKNYTTTNHQGKAIDIQFSKGDWKIRGEQKKNLDTLRKIRDEFYIKYLGGQENWTNPNKFSIEPIDLLYKKNGKVRFDHTFSWIHFDVRQFDAIYLEDKYFCKSTQTLNGKSIVQLAREMGLNDLCNCLKGFTPQNKPEAEKKDSNGRVDPKKLKLSDKGKQFIKDWEKFEPKAYNDSEGYCTIGYGHLIKRKKCEDITIPDEFKNGITEKRAAELFELRLPKFEEAIKRDIVAPLYQHEYDALVSLVFNTGPEFLNTGGKNNGETQIKKKINNKEYEAGADEMSDVTNGGTSGLVKRRKAEINMFKNNVYDSSH